MKNIRSRAIRLLSLMFILSMMPLYASAATPKLTDASSNWYSFELGKDYDFSCKVGDDPTFDCDNDSDLEIELDSVKSSNPDVVSVELITQASFFTLTAEDPGTATVTVKDAAGTVSKFKVTVKGEQKTAKKSKIETTKWVYKFTTKVKVKATNVQKGDIIKFKVGKKTYTKKIKKNANKATVTFKIKKPGFYGKKYKLTLNRKKKIVAKELDYVYISNYVHVGDTKKKVKWLTNWNDPVRKNKSAYSEQWCYDWDEDGYYDAYLYFSNGKVSNWTIYE